MPLVLKIPKREMLLVGRTCLLFPHYTEVIVFSDMPLATVERLDFEGFPKRPMVRPLALPSRNAILAAREEMRKWK